MATGDNHFSALGGKATSHYLTHIIFTGSTDYGNYFSFETTHQKPLATAILCFLFIIVFMLLLAQFA
jgi:hypothetical protein